MNCWIASCFTLRHSAASYFRRPRPHAGQWSSHQNSDHNAPLGTISATRPDARWRRTRNHTDKDLQGVEFQLQLNIDMGRQIDTQLSLNCLIRPSAALIHFSQLTNSSVVRRLQQPFSPLF